MIQSVSKTVVIMILFSLAFERTDNGIVAANALVLVEFLSYLEQQGFMCILISTSVVAHFCLPVPLVIKTLLVVHQVELRS